MNINLWHQVLEQKFTCWRPQLAPEPRVSDPRFKVYMKFVHHNFKVNLSLLVDGRTEQRSSQCVTLIFYIKYSTWKMKILHIACYDETPPHCCETVHFLSEWSYLLQLMQYKWRLSLPGSCAFMFLQRLWSVDTVPGVDEHSDFNGWALLSLGKHSAYAPQTIWCELGVGVDTHYRWTPELQDNYRVLERELGCM